MTDTKTTAPQDHGTAAEALIAAAEAGWNACRRQVYLLSEDYVERTHALKNGESVEGNFYRGQYDVSKSFAKAFNAFEARDCDYFKQIDFAALAAAPVHQDHAAPILKGVGKINGDGWKDSTKKCDIVFVWNLEHPKPYAPGQYPRVGSEHWSASTEQYHFVPATIQEIQGLLSPLRIPTPEGFTDDAEREEFHAWLKAGKPQKWRKSKPIENTQDCDDV